MAMADTATAAIADLKNVLRFILLSSDETSLARLLPGNPNRTPGAVRQINKIIVNNKCRHKN